MQPELAIPAAFVVALMVTAMATPVAIRVARATDFLDCPADYKAHRAATPYLGGSAILAGVLMAAFVFGREMDGFAVVMVCTLLFWALGTVDDKFNLSPYSRVAVQVGAGVVLFEAGLGWGVFENPTADLALTVFWLVGIVNAVNLMDNMDGMAATTTGISTGGAGAIALLTGADALAALCFAISGACMAFLHFNLARPSRIFMGDGGSMPLGFLAAVVTMQAAVTSHGGLPAVLIAGVLMGMFILDTTLVVLSRRRRGVAVLSGGRDHVSHRLATRLGHPVRVAIALGTTQAGLVLLAILGAHHGDEVLALVGSTALTLGAIAIWVLEQPRWRLQIEAARSSSSPAPAGARA